MFSNKVVIVTGSSSGIGRVAARLFAKEEASVVLHGQNLERLQKAESEVKELHPSAKTVTVSGPIQAESTWNEIVSSAIDKFGRIDVLLNNAGISDDGKDPNGLECFQYCMEVNVKSVIGLTRACLPHLKKTKGTIVNTSSALARKIHPGLPMYSVSKAALEHYSRHAAYEYAPFGIRVNCVAPGLIETQFHSRGAAADPVEAKADAEQVPLQRMGYPEEIAKVMAFLASENCSYVTGEVVRVDGGLLIMP